MFFYNCPWDNHAQSVKCEMGSNGECPRCERSVPKTDPDDENNGRGEQEMDVLREAGQGQEMTNSRPEKSQPVASYRPARPLRTAFGKRQ